jgi:hypothetical protein
VGYEVKTAPAIERGKRALALRRAASPARNPGSSSSVTRHAVVQQPSSFVFVIAAIVAMAAVGEPGVAQTMPKCDPVDPISDVGWSVVPSLETIGTADGSPYQAGASGDWFVDRTTTLLPFCNYYNEIGIYSMRSYTLSRQLTKERIAICKGAGGGGSVAVPPYAGRCPPN